MPQNFCAYKHCPYKSKLLKNTRFISVKYHERCEKQMLEDDKMVKIQDLIEKAEHIFD